MMRLSKIEEVFRRDVRLQSFFILLCVLISRGIIVISFLLWKEKSGFEGNFFEAFSRFDTTWYKSIIQNGYYIEPCAGDKADAANWAFFPLVPIIMHLVHMILPLEYDVLAFLINSVFLILALIMAVKYILLTRNDNMQAMVYVVLIAFGMYNFYFSALYTESVFLFLLVSFFVCMEKRRYVWMGIIGALASATRNTGIMLVFSVAIHYVIDYLENNKFSIKTFICNFFKNKKLVLGTVIIPFGLFGYMGYLYLLIGDSLAFMHIQRAWGREINNPVSVLFNSLSNIDSFVFYLSLVAVWGIYCLWILLWEKRWTEVIMTFLFIMIPLSTSVDSIPRYLIGSFFPLLAFTDGIGKWKKYKIVALVLFSIVFGEICLCGWFGSKAFVM